MENENHVHAEPVEPLLIATAKVIGRAAGRIASVANSVTEKIHHGRSAAELESHPSATDVPRRGKLMKKNKQRLPRRLKKALQKTNAANEALTLGPVEAGLAMKH